MPPDDHLSCRHVSGRCIRLAPPPARVDYRCTRVGIPSLGLYLYGRPNRLFGCSNSGFHPFIQCIFVDRSCSVHIILQQLLRYLRNDCSKSTLAESTSCLAVLANGFIINCLSLSNCSDDCVNNMLQGTAAKQWGLIWVFGTPAGAPLVRQVASV